MIVYDIEISTAIPSDREPRIAGMQYCESWHDHAHMGISVICAYEYCPWETGFGVGGRYGVYLSDNFDQFADLIARCHEHGDIVVGFNSKSFDDLVCQARGLHVETDIDLLHEMWAAIGLDPTQYVQETHGGFGLNAVAQANLGQSKIGHGANAPLQWHRGLFGRVINYCMRDVWLTQQLIEVARKRGYLYSPKHAGQTIDLPFVRSLQG